MAVLDDLSAALQAGKKKDVAALVQQALDEGISADDILNKGLIDAMTVVGDNFSAGKVFVPEMLVAARAMTAGTEILKPYLVGEGATSAGKAVIGTVKGDMHDIGKNLVRMMIESRGIEIEDLGVDVGSEVFVEYVKTHDDLQLVCLSALLTTTLPSLRDTVAALREADPDGRVKILVGGAPVTEEFAKEIGADAYSADAGSAAVVAFALVSEE